MHEFETDFEARFEAFCTEVCEVNRYFYSDKTYSFLQDLYTYISSDDKSRGYSLKTIKAGEVFYRARAHQFLATENKYEQNPFSAEKMKPTANMRANGRLNAYNINTLYLASDPCTAVSEVRAASRAPVSVAQFKTNKELTIAKFDYFSDAQNDFWHWSNPGPTFSLAHRFSQPLDHQEHQSREYIPTQIIAEFLRSKNIDGIEHPSQFLAFEENTEYLSLASKIEENNAGTNLCLFDTNAADCIPESIQIWQLEKRINIIKQTKDS